MSVRRFSGVSKGVVGVLAAVTVGLPLTVLGPVAFADSVPTDTVVSDSFDRSVSSGWGTAAQGGTWVSSQDTKVSVSAGRGWVAPDSGQGVVQTLPSSLTDMRATTSVLVDSLPTRGNGMSAFVGVRSSSSGAYLADFRFGRAGALSLNIKRQRTGSQNTVLVGDTLLPTRAVAGTAYTVQVEVTGTSPVEVRARAWPQSETAPAWQVSVSDSASARVTEAGGLLLRSYLSSSSDLVRVSYDDVTVQMLSDAAVPPEPPVDPVVPPEPPVDPVVPPEPPVDPVVPPEPPVDPVVPPEPPVDPVSSAGSVPVGSADYPVPANAVFVTADGSRTGSGTSASPFGSLAYGIEKASAGSTIVMRGGTYHESTTVPFFKKLTIQSYPKEAVWLDGSSVVTGWQRAGSAWVVSGWNHIFDPRVSHTEGVDQSDYFLDPAFPMAGHPDQVWVSGAKLRQVASMGSVVPGTFFVDRPGRRLYIGTDPAGKRVEASTLQQGMVIQGTGTVVRGIGLRRYANTFWMGGAISTQVNDIVLENVVSTQNATQGIDGWGKKMRFNRITITESGALGLGLNTADDLVLSNSLIRKNNIESFEREPISGGVKIARSRRVLISGNRFDQNTTTGLWFDAANFDVTVVGNTFSGNGAHGLELEWSSRVVVANNYFIRNAQAGLFVIDANSISVWNNTFHDNKTYSIRIFQYAPRSSDPIFAKVRDVSVRNNILSYGPGSYQYITEDFERKETGQTMRVTSEGNAYHRASSTSPTNFAVWANGSRLSGYSNLTAFRAATGNDLRSTLNEGTSILTDRYQLTPAALGSTASVALPIPVTVASAIGVASNTRKLGAVSPIIE